MARRRKLEKFAELLTYPHVFEMTEPGSSSLRQTNDTTVDLREQWSKDAFHNDHPICLELACGRGEYSVGLARLFPERNFIGVDIKGARIHKGATIALRENLGNVCFLRTRIEQIQLYFGPDEVDDIWITFPDPFPAKENRRLTAEIFLTKYCSFLKTGGKLHLKTDDTDLYHFSVNQAEKHQNYRIIEKNSDISKIRQNRQELNLQTYYEIQHLSNKKSIKYLQLEKFD